MYATIDTYRRHTIVGITTFIDPRVLIGSRVHFIRKDAPKPLSLCKGFARGFKLLSFNELDTPSNYFQGTTQREAEEEELVYSYININILVYIYYIYNIAYSFTIALPGHL